MRRFSLSVLLVALIGTMAACSSRPEKAGERAEQPQSIEQQAWSAIRAGALLVDVRTRAEFDQGHLDGAILIPYDQIVARVAELGPDKQRPIVLYCRTGRRSGIATKSLQDLGFTNLLNGGGFENLKRAR